MGKAQTILIFLILGLFGCATPSPVLVDSEIPWKMSSGEYVSASGEIKIIADSTPRWSVSEAYLMESFREEKNFDFNKYLKNIVIGLGLVFLFFTIIIYIIKQ